MIGAPNKQTAALLLLSTVSFALSYATAIVFARVLGARGYEEYAVAVSSAVILATLAEMGVGKYAMRIIPTYTENRKWSLESGYFRFSAALILVTSVVLTLVVAVAEFLGDGGFDDYTLAVVLPFLPAMAWVGAGSEFVMANRAAIRSALVTRLLVPGSTLAAGVVWVLSPIELTAARGAFCYGLGWLFGLTGVVWFLRQSTRHEVLEVQAKYRSREWLASAFPFLSFALLVTVLAKIGVIILEIVRPQDPTVAVYAVAAETGSFIFLVAKSTDKMFLPDVSLLIERRELAELRAGRLRRWAWLGPICVLFLLVIFLFGKNILSIFGPEFVAGYPALCIIAVASSVWTMTSLAPPYLKYVGKSRWVLFMTALTVVAHIGLCVPLGYAMGATGAALSYAIPVTLLHVTMALRAGHHVRREAGGQELSGHD